jgi:polyhydroxyalkanoate synthesis regulator phasin
MGRVGAHADGRPLGRPANKETREARRRAHDAFDQLWKSGQMNRSEAYSLAAKLLNRSRESMHIALLDKEQCEELATKAARFLAK